MSLNRADTRSVGCPYALTDDQRLAFERDGFLILRGQLPSAVLDRLEATFTRAVDTLAKRWRDAGLITQTYRDLPLGERYLRILRDGGEKIPMHGAWRRILVSRPVFELWQRPELLGPMRSLIGDELYAHGIWSGRPRDPLRGRLRVHWHQDAHYYKNWAAADGRLISVWIPLVPVDETNSCMQYVAGSHQAGWIEPTLTATGEFAIADTDVDPDRVRTAVMDPGDVVLFADTTLHQATRHRAERIRWSIDIRFGQATPGVVGKTPRGYRCFSAEDPAQVEDFATWAARYDYHPSDLAREITQIEVIDPDVLAPLWSVPDIDVF
jgi:Phytanoyl-CoA dioxygenase (PhyH)